METSRCGEGSVERGAGVAYLNETSHFHVKVGGERKGGFM